MQKDELTKRDRANLDKLAKRFDGGAYNQARRIYYYWRERGKTPSRAFDLAVAAWTDDRRYEQLKRL